ncbi:MAG TPA: glycosyltransferase family 4 protein [Syntrophales bacterium]|nr:glycosyltransferase family 4 protein [Syntrophales bacterium]
MLGTRNRKIRVVVPTVYRPECPTVRSRLLPLCRELVPKGFEFEFLVIGEGKNNIEPGITYSGYRSYVELASRISSSKKRDTDILFPSKPYTITGLLSLLVARLKGIGYVLDIDDRTFPSEINKWWRLPLYLQEYFSDRFLKWLKTPTVVASRGLAEYWGKHALYAPNSTDLCLFDRTRWNSGYIREKVGLTGQILIWPAVFFQETDRQYMLDIFAALQKSGEEVVLLVIGDGEYLPHIKSRAKSLKLENVVFTGTVDYRDMPNYYASATAGLLPMRNNHYDSCKGPIKLFEYMAMELPVIATDIGEAREVIPRADCGILIPFDDPDRAAAMIAELMSSSERLQNLGKNGRRFLLEQHSFAHHADQLEILLRDCVVNAR